MPSLLWSLTTMIASTGWSCARIAAMQRLSDSRRLKVVTAAATVMRLLPEDQVPASPCDGVLTDKSGRGFGTGKTVIEQSLAKAIPVAISSFALLPTILLAFTERQAVRTAPALEVTAQGTLLAFCEGRKHSRADAGEIDLLLCTVGYAELPR